MLTRYTVSSNIGSSFRCGLNHVVLDHGTPVYLSSDLDPLLARVVGALEKTGHLHDAQCPMLCDDTATCSCWQAEAQRLIAELKEVQP